MSKQADTPIKVSVQIDAEAVQQLAKEGRLSEFVDTFPALLAGHLKNDIVNQLVSGGAIGFNVGFMIDDDYGTLPPKPWPLPLNQAMTGNILRRLAR